jgi:endonuclease/exonuclease/phosphatase (EEP) superfamily protein YafD
VNSPVARRIAPKTTAYVVLGCLSALSLIPFWSQLGNTVLLSVATYLKFRELRSLLTIIGGSEGPVIAMGDFNARAPGEGTIAPAFGQEAA